MYQPTSTSNYYNNFSLSPEVSRKNTYEMSTRYSAINPISQSQFLDEEQVETIITTTTTVNQPNPAKRLHSQSYYCTSDADLVNQLQRANQSICQLTNDLKGFNESIRKRTGLDIDTRKSQYSMYDTSISPISNNNLNADFTFPSPNPRTARSYTSHVNFTQEIPTTVSQNLNAPLRSSQYIQQLNKSSNNLRESTLKESNPLRISTYHDGTKTVVNFPFTTYTDKDEEVVDTRANYRSTTQIPTQQEDENSSRRYYIKHEDLEYEEFESFVDPSQNYKRIKYPYQNNWQRVYEAPEFIQNLINAQKNRSEVVEQEQSSPMILNQQQQQAVKYSSYIPKASINLFDDSNCRSYAETNNTLSGSYIASANNIPYSQYY